MIKTGDRQFGPLQEVVARYRRIMMESRLVLGLLMWLTVCLGMWLVLFFLDNLLNLPPALRLALVLGAAGVMMSELWKRLVSPLWQLEAMENTALLLEHKYTVPENMLINALYFERRRFRRGEKPFARRTIETAISLMAKADPRELWPSRRLTGWLVAVLVVMLLWAGYGISHGRYALNALARFTRPLADIPPAGSLVLKITPSSDVTVTEADDLPVTVEIKHKPNSRGLQSYPEIVWLEGADYVGTERGKNKTVTMKAVEQTKGRFSYTFAGVQRPFAFRAFAADTYSPSIKVSVNAVPRIKESQFYVTPPAYTGSGSVSSLGPPEAVSGLANSQLRVDVKLDKPANGLWWKALGQTIEFKKTDRVWRAQTRLQRPGSYQIEVQAPAVDKRIAIASGSILLQQDSVPEVEFVQTERSRVVNPGERLKLGIDASDDFGLARTFVTLQQMQADSTAETLKGWDYEGPPGEKARVQETMFLSIDASVFKPGGNYVLQAFAQDFSPANNTGKSQPLTLQVRSLEELTIEQDDPDSAAFGALDKAIQAEQSALGVTKNLLTNLDDVISDSKTKNENADSLSRHQAELSKRQQRVGTCMSEAWDVSSPPRPAFVIKLVALRDGEHARIMEKIETVGTENKEEPASRSSTLGTRALSKPAISRSLRSVERLQAFLLEQLIALKGVIAKRSQAEAEKVAAEILGQSTDSLDTSLEETLKEMVKELDEFVTQQKQIMHERQMIMDQPPEDFSEGDEEELEELALDQSKLAEILSNVVNDFTNLDLLDFGDNAIVESMKSIYEQADELADKADEAAQMRQARVDAHRLETEAVEMAEELMINCEATLGFYDNIQFIAEIPEDEQLVAPLAELPWELEDLVADLITSEEEMRPEVEDIGSYLTSLDHTAGPVSDGTISSTSAKGKTGDQKPEDNVIQGRSGAGRSGMSDGQLVEPVAKALSDNEYGLRERISSTPLESGQVRDEDTKAQTGGTGLGKTTDHASPFGVGGKLPPRVLDMMEATAEKQHNIQQSAREIVPKLRRHNLPTTALETSIQAMEAVQEAITSKGGIDIRRAYSEAVDALKQSHLAVGKQVRVQFRRDDALEKKLDDMLWQKRQNQFRGYEHMISAYFEALAQGKNNAKPDSLQADENNISD